jgi:hypothetical protein
LVARAVNDARHVDPVGDDPVINDVIPVREITKPSLQLVALRSQLGGATQYQAGSLDLCHE